MNPLIHAHLVSGLVGDHVEAYQTSAEFYNAINALAQMLPPMVDGLAAQVAENEKSKVALLHELMTQAGPGFEA